jgi:hypothetical protein
MSRAVHLLPLYTFMAWTGTTLHIDTRTYLVVRKDLSKPKTLYNILKNACFCMFGCFYSPSQPRSWKTTHYHLSLTAYSVYSQLPSA